MIIKLRDSFPISPKATTFRTKNEIISKKFEKTLAICGIVCYNNKYRVPNSVKRVSMDKMGGEIPFFQRKELRE